MGRRRYQDSESEEESRNLSQTPPKSLEDLIDQNQRSPSIDKNGSQEPTEVIPDDVISDRPQDFFSKNATTVTETSTKEQPVASNEEVASSEIQKGIPDQEEGAVIEDLGIEILEAIGKRVAEERVLTPAIPKSIAVRLEDILKNGLPKEEREKLIKEHTPPKNCVAIDPPKLNEEIKVSVSEISTKRDDRIIEKQKKITASLALLGSTIMDVINDKKDNEKLSLVQIKLIKKLSEAARLLADLQRDETLTRRNLILAAISNAQKETLDVAKADEWLFGQKLGERLKAAKSIERSGKDLKIKLKNAKESKNSKAPPRRQPFKGRTSGGYRNRSYRKQFDKKDWGNQSGKYRNNSQSQTSTQQKKA